ncbi:hypothetical protein GCM10011386_02780 [Parapedobacter defluvii]|uniref:Uncharacterized protein n=2 Tax=Parapedobacter defluvii TaxID=2045106 RepID=A0ABQ1L101_9SPHI|nr:hypothetical protein GCM10011386_02780 [Parapedobacter defluvii]
MLHGNKPDDIIWDPYALDSLKIPERHQYSESELESRIIELLQHAIDHGSVFNV